MRPEVVSTLLRCAKDTGPQSPCFEEIRSKQNLRRNGLKENLFLSKFLSENHLTSSRKWYFNLPLNPSTLLSSLCPPVWFHPICCYPFLKHCQHLLQSPHSAESVSPHPLSLLYWNLFLERPEKATLSFTQPESGTNRQGLQMYSSWIHSSSYLTGFLQVFLWEQFKKS